MDFKLKLKMLIVAKLKTQMRHRSNYTAKKRFLILKVDFIRRDYLF